jgi:prepilin-type N-terminal cleavage/methylation domain-containing protein
MMKTRSSKILRGFTLVELLVVITIIAVLAGIATPMGLSAIQKGKKTTCLAAATAIETAVGNFYNEYGSMPSSGTDDTTVKTNATAGINLLKALVGLDTTLNPRGIKFLSVKEGKANKNGLIYNSTGTDVTGMYDPWGGAYNVMLDLGYDEKVTTAPTAGGGATLNGRRVAVWSDGASSKLNDDVKTWGQ